MAAQITSLPTPPSRQAPATFSVTADAFLGALPTFVTEANALASEAETDAATASSKATESAGYADDAQAFADDAATQAGLAASSADTAAISANVTLWISGITYAQAKVVLSPADMKMYTRIIAGAGTTDPSADTTNWVALIPPTPFNQNLYQSLGGI